MLVDGEVQPVEGVWEDWLVKLDDQAHAVVASPETPGARHAVLRYRRLATFAGGSVLELCPETGRMHQLRVQTSSRGWPIRGDERYGSSQPFGAKPDNPRERVIGLHARRLTFLHPIRYEEITVEAPLPDYWREYIY